MIYIHIYNWSSMPESISVSGLSGNKGNTFLPYSTFDLAEGRNNHQYLCNTLVYGRGKGGRYPDWVGMTFAKWRKDLDAGRDILVTFRAREVSKSLLALNSAIANTPELKGAERKWVVTLGRPDFALEQAARIYQEMSIEQIENAIHDAGSYSAIQVRLERLAGRDGFLLLFPQFAPWSTCPQQLTSVRNELATFMGLDLPDTSLAPFRWRSVFIRRMVAAINNSWGKPSSANLESELDRFEQCVTAPEGIFAAREVLSKIAVECRKDWENASGKKWLDVPLPQQMRVGGILSGLAIHAPETAEFLARNVRLLPHDFQKAARNMLEDAGIEIPKSPEMAVLTLAYNHESYIAQCVESVASQKRNFSLEHIIVDDMSTDGTKQTIAKLAAKYPHIRPIFLENRYRGENILALFRACGSKYAALCDGDDYIIDNGKLQKQRDFLEQNPDCTMCAHPVHVRFENKMREDFVYPPPGSMKKAKHGKYAIDDLFNGNFAQTNAVMYRWRFMKGLPVWFRADLCPGDWYWHLLHAEMGKIGFLPETMAVYRRHDKALYAHAFISDINHRRDQGLAELATYQAVNEHFKGKYYEPLSRLANGVFSDLLRIQVKDNDPSMLANAVEQFPVFSATFMKTVKIVKRTTNTTAR